jgi:hypothetical protein
MMGSGLTPYLLQKALHLFVCKRNAGKRPVFCHVLDWSGVIFRSRKVGTENPSGDAMGFFPRPEGGSDSLGRGKLPSAASPGARLLFHDSPRACQFPDPVPSRPYSRCVGRPGFIDSRDVGIRVKRFCDQNPIVSFLPTIQE